MKHYVAFLEYWQESPSALSVLKNLLLAIWYTSSTVSTNVERSFSKYKNVLSYNMCSLTFENLRMLTFIYCNSEWDDLNTGIYNIYVHLINILTQ
jgi:hypothetical protein